MDFIGEINSNQKDIPCIDCCLSGSCPVYHSLIKDQSMKDQYEDYKEKKIISRYHDFAEFVKDRIKVLLKFHSPQFGVIYRNCNKKETV